MLIAHLEPPSPHLQGDQVYRTVGPCAALAKVPGVYVVSGCWLSPAMQRAAEVADVLMLCQAVDVDLVPVMLARRRQGRTTIVEINDNFLAPVASQTVASFYSNPLNRSTLLWMASHAHGLQLASVGLQERFAHLNQHVEVFANQLATLEPLKAKPGGPLRVGWGGSLGHQEDIRWCMPALQRILAEHADVELAIMAPHELREMFAWVPSERLDFRVAASLQAYGQFLDSLHVGIAPLLGTEFNVCRSDVKFLEYAAHGVAAVLSHALPYAAMAAAGRSALMATSVEDFYACIHRLVDHPEQLAAQRAAAHAYVGRHRLETQHVPQRLDFLHKLTKDPSRGDKEFNAIVRAHGDPCELLTTGYARLGFGPLEACLYNALLSAQSDTPVALLATAKKLSPRSYLPWLYSAHLGPVADRPAALQQAMALRPEGLAAQMAWAEMLLAGKLFMACLEHVRLVTERWPHHAPAHELLGRVCATVGDLQAAAAAYRAALAHNKFYRTAGHRLAAMLCDSGDAAGALAILLQDPTHGEHSWLSHYLRGDAYRRLENWPKAKEALLRALAESPEKKLVRGMLAKTCLDEGDVVTARQWLAGH